MNIPLFPLSLALVFVVGLAAGVYAVLLWSKLSRLEGKMEARFIFRVEHELEHQGLWEAIHHHEHDFRGRVRR